MERLLPVATKTIHPPEGEGVGGGNGRNDFSIHLLAFLCRQQAWQQQDTARNATTHPRSALDENSLVRRRLHSALRPLVDSEGEEEGLPLGFVGGSQGKTVTTYKQLLPSFLPSSTRSSLDSFHFIPSCCRFNLSWNDCNVRPQQLSHFRHTPGMSDECHCQVSE